MSPNRNRNKLNETIRIVFLVICLTYKSVSRLKVEWMDRRKIFENFEKLASSFAESLLFEPEVYNQSSQISFQISWRFKYENFTYSIIKCEFFAIELIES